jgi:hypothetical protein
MSKRMLSNNLFFAILASLFLTAKYIISPPIIPMNIGNRDTTPCWGPFESLLFRMPYVKNIMETDTWYLRKVMV